LQNVLGVLNLTTNLQIIKILACVNLPLLYTILTYNVFVLTNQGKITYIVAKIDAF